MASKHMRIVAKCDAELARIVKDISVAATRGDQKTLDALLKRKPQIIEARRQAMLAVDRERRA